jgi:hypothetical protein
MDQLVFVHGVNTRKEGDYDLEVATRDQLFKEVVWKGAQLEIRNSFWGGAGATFSKDLACLPSKGAKAASFGLLGGIAAGPTTKAEPLTAVAENDFGAAVDAIFVAMLEEAQSKREALKPEQIAQFAAAGDYAEANPTPPDWAKGTTSDDVVVSELRKRVTAVGPAAFGLGDALSRAGKAITDRARNLVSSGIAPVLRDQASPRFARFLGDIFVYLYSGSPDPKRAAIRKILAADLNAAWAAAQAGGGNLIVIGHSLGGVILYDMLRDTTSGLTPGLKVRLLVTVGSQPGLFEEMGLFGSRVEGSTKGEPPKAIENWWNVFDPVDLLSFRCEPIFERVKDFEFSSATGMIDAHSTYFKRPRFHARLRERLKEAGVLS